MARMIPGFFIAETPSKNIQKILKILLTYHRIGGIINTSTREGGKTMGKKREKKNRRKLELATVILLVILRMIELALKLME